MVISTSTKGMYECEECNAKEGFRVEFGLFLVLCCCTDTLGKMTFSVVYVYSVRMSVSL